MSISVRHVEEKDATGVQQILVSEHVVQGTMRLPYSGLEYAAQRIKPHEGEYKLVATSGESVVGYCELITHPDQPRRRHAGEINLVATHPDHRGKGIGKILMDALLDLSDRWLQLQRLELIVWANNKRAIALYNADGFELEGTMRQYALCDGGFMDALIMGRISSSSSKSHGSNEQRYAPDLR